MYNVKIELFEGPLDLLLHLVDKNHLNITEIALASICGEYERYLQHLQDLNLEVESSFLTVFASLLEIKSKVLLPVLATEEEEEPLSEHELVAQLREYRNIKKSAQILKQMKDEMDLSYPRIPHLEPETCGVLLTSQISPGDLMDIYVGLLREFAMRGEVETIELVRDEVSMPFILKLISNKIRSRFTINFYDLFDSVPNITQFIITFLALLEMARRRKINLVQDEEHTTLTIINKRFKNIEEDTIEADVEEKLAG